MEDAGSTPSYLYRYLAAVVITGPVVAIAVAMHASSAVGADDLLRAALMVALAALAERYPIHLSHKTNINVATAAYMAMIIVFPVGLPGMLALTAIIAGQVLRRASLIEGAFNAAQGALYVTAGAVAYWLTVGIVGNGSYGGGFIAAVVVAASAMHLVNSLLVSGAGAFQMGLNPLRVWAGNVTFDLAGHAVLCAIGVVAALLTRDYPLALPVLALPVILVQRSPSQMVKLRADTHEALAALVKVLELRDPYTAGHSERVAATARAMALRLGLTAEEADVVASAGRVHDIGKIAVDPLILTKPGKLTEDEWIQMKLHPAHSAHVISHFDAYLPCHGMVRHHHEQWDGGGYPDGLTGDASPLGARILAVADTYDALTSDRPYRRGMTREQAVTILQEGAGTQWDPRVVAAMIEYLTVRSPETHRQPAEESIARNPVPA